MIITALDAMCSPPPTPGTGEILDFNWVTQETVGLNQLALLIMQFLENGAYDTEDESPTQMSELPWGSSKMATYWGGDGKPPAAEGQLTDKKVTAKGKGGDLPNEGKGAKKPSKDQQKDKPIGKGNKKGRGHAGEGKGNKDKSKEGLNKVKKTVTK